MIKWLGSASIEKTLKPDFLLNCIRVGNWCFKTGTKIENLGLFFCLKDLEVMNEIRSILCKSTMLFIQIQNSHDFNFLVKRYGWVLKSHPNISIYDIVIEYFLSYVLSRLQLNHR